jgi:chromosome partitioning protein
MDTTVLPPVTLDELAHLAHRAATVIERLREKIFAPGAEKRLELRFNVRTAGEMVG